MKAAEHWLLVVLFIMLYKVVLTFQSVHKILICDHSNKSFSAVLRLVLFVSQCSAKQNLG